MTNDCSHKKIRKHFSFGKKSKPQLSCRNCGKILKPKYFMEKRKGNQMMRRRKRK